jgi:myo-inositol-1(or 4)-monophosphatase
MAVGTGPAELLDLATTAAQRAADLLVDGFGRARATVETKSTATDMVSEMDRASERLIVSTLLAARPDDGVVAEEGGATPGTSGLRWVIDPLDGTTNYAHGLPVFGVSIALETERRIVLGVVYDPTRDELFVGERGGGATLNDAPVRVSATAALGEALLVTGFPYNIRETRDTNLAEYAAFSVRARAVRRLGSAVIDLAYVACGRFDGFWELTLGAWDVAAGGLLVEEAGGALTGIDGGPMDVDAPTLVASNGRIHEQILRVLKEVRGS